MALVASSAVLLGDLKFLFHLPAMNPEANAIGGFGESLELIGGKWLVPEAHNHTHQAIEDDERIAAERDDPLGLGPLGVDAGFGAD